MLELRVFLLPTWVQQGSHPARCIGVPGVYPQFRWSRFTCKIIGNLLKRTVATTPFFLISAATWQLYLARKLLDGKVKKHHAALPDHTQTIFVSQAVQVIDVKHCKKMSACLWSCAVALPNQKRKGRTWECSAWHHFYQTLAGGIRVFHLSRNTCWYVSTRCV